ncbi:hypothetical protein ACVWYH_007974 [Bradyrhizobium sp. GM24.11]
MRRSSKTLIVGGEYTEQIASFRDHTPQGATSFLRIA